jgi:methyl-accepting chemotaxis protein
MKLNDIRVSTKLWGTILGLLVLMLAVAAWTQVRGARVMDAAMDKVQTYEGRITTVVRWKGLTEAAVNMVVASAVTTDTALAQSYDAQVKNTIARITGVQEQIVKAATGDADKKAMEDIAAARKLVLAHTAKVKEIKAAGDAAATQAFVDKQLLPAVAVYLDMLEKMVTVQEAQRDAAKQEAIEARRSNALVGLASAAAVLAAAVALAFTLVRSITQPLTQAVQTAGAIAQGDLTQQVDSARKDEFGQLLRALSDMVGKLRGVVTEVHRGVDSVSTASTQIAHGNQDLSARTEQTAANLQQTAASMEELTSTVTQSADTARQANQLAGSAAGAATRGGEVVSQVVSSMQQISDASRKIADIIGVIDGIAFQTNILALNAAVEAARAGEQGRGFAVVAGEVRSLAQRSAQAAKEIKSLINASVETVETGSRQVSQAGESMQEIVASVRRVSDLIGEITASSTEQRDGIGQVNTAVANLDQMTQQNAALVEESAAAAAALREQAQRLSEVVAVFNVGAAAPRAQLQAMAAPAMPVPAPKAVPAPRKPAAAAAAKTPAPKVPAKKPAAAAAPALATTADDEWESF